MISVRQVLLFLLLSGEFLTFSGCDEIGSNIMGIVRYSRRSNAPIIRRLVDNSLRACVVECGLRSSCTRLNYQRFTKMCELLGASYLPFEADQSRAWIYVEMDDSLKQVFLPLFLFEYKNIYESNILQVFHYSSKNHVKGNFVSRHCFSFNMEYHTACCVH